MLSTHAVASTTDLHLIFSVDMRFLMSCEIGTLSEAFVATRVGAEIGLLPRVCSQVSSKIEVQRKLLSAELALERFFTLKMI